MKKNMGLGKKILRQVKRFLIRTIGSKTDEWYWRFRHLFDHSWAKKYISQETVNHPHRKFLVRKITNYFPFESVLEIGCASGANLYILAENFPETKLYGIDISGPAIEEGRKYFSKKNIKNISLIHKSINTLSNLFKDKSIDVVFTDAVLIYFGPDQIDSVIQELIRIANKGIVFFELHHDSPASLYKDNWIHNYRLLFNNFFPEIKIKITPIPFGLWAGDWNKFGSIIEIIL